MAKEKEAAANASNEAPAAQVSSQAPATQPAAQQPTTPLAPPVSAAPAIRQPPTATVARWLELADEFVPMLDGNQRLRLHNLLTGLATPKQLVPVVPPSPYESGKLYDFRVSHNAPDAPVGEFVARDDLEAWAFYCEQIKRQPSPKTRKIECLGEHVDQAMIDAQAKTTGQAKAVAQQAESKGAAA